MSQKSSNVGLGSLNTDLRKRHFLLMLSSAALCQVYDSIFRKLKGHTPSVFTLAHVSDTEDLPMARVKFNVNTEYAYIQNFKVLQSQHLAILHIYIHFKKLKL